MKTDIFSDELCCYKWTVTDKKLFLDTLDSCNLVVANLQVSTTECSKRHSTTHQMPPPARSSNVSSSRSTLAANQASCHI